MKGAQGLAVAGLLANATVWGLSWIGFRGLDALGIHPLWATAAIYAFAAVVIGSLRAHAWRELGSTPALALIALCSGLNNACFNTAVVTGDVVRVVLLFYLMPVWAVLLARPLLGETLSARAAARVALGLGGAMLVLYQPGTGLPYPRTAADWAALVGGVLFALNNLLLRKFSQASETARGLAMFLGGMTLAGLAAAAFAAQGTIAWPHFGAPGALPLLLLWCTLFLIGNLGLQIGASRLPANLTAVVMLTEVFVASVSAWTAGTSVLELPDLVGGAMILAAPWVLREAPRPAPA